MKDKFKLFQGDCLELMKQIPDGSVDLVLCDLPYGTTACKWDSVIPFDAIWAEYRRVLKPNGAAVLTCVQPFTSALIASNMRDFAYCWYWNKSRPTGFVNAKKQPLRCVEEVAVFYRRQPTYNPQGLLPFGRVVKTSKSAGGGTILGETVGNGNGALRSGADYLQEWTNYPRQVLKIASEGKTMHPTQKPVALMEYLIKTYTNPGDKVLDNCMGSGTTGVAAVRNGRFFVGMELDPGYFQIAQNRIQRAFDGEGS